MWKNSAFKYEVFSGIGYMFMGILLCESEHSESLCFRILFLACALLLCLFIQILNKHHFYGLLYMMYHFDDECGDIDFEKYRAYRNIVDSKINLMGNLINEYKDWELTCEFEDSDISPDNYWDILEEYNRKCDDKD